MAVNDGSVQLLSVGASANNVESINLISLAGATNNDLTAKMSSRALNVDVGLNLRVRRKRRHRQRRQRHNRRRRCSGGHFTVRQGARSGDCLSAYVFAVDDGSVRIHEGPGFKNIVRAPHRPHAGGKVRIEVAVEDRIADHLVAIATAVVNHLQGVAGARTDHLAIEIAALIAIGRLEPLMRVLMMNVSHAQRAAAVKNSELHMIVDVAVVNVRWVVRKESGAGFHGWLHRVTAVWPRHAVPATWRRIESIACVAGRLEFSIRGQIV